MNERVLIIVGIIAQYFMNEQDFSNEREIIEELLGAGFKEEDISEAFTWMEKITLHPQPGNNDHLQLDLPPLRIFSQQEQQRLSLAAQGFLIRLQTAGIISTEIEEEIILKACSDGDEQVELDEIRSLTVLTMFSAITHDHSREIDCIVKNKLDKLYN